MAEKKEKKVKSKVDTTEKISGDIDTLLNDMSKLSLDKITNGKMKIKVVKENDVITKDELVITGILSEEHKASATKAKEHAHTTLKAVTDGEIKIEFESELEI